MLLQTRCGPIEVQEAGTGVPLLVVHGSGGGHDQGKAFAGAVAQHGIRRAAVVGGSAGAPSELLATASPQERARVGSSSQTGWPPNLVTGAAMLVGEATKSMRCELGI